MARQLFIKQHVADPATFETFYAGQVVSVGDGEEDISEEQADRLVGHHGSRVEDLSDIEGKSKDEVIEVARAIGVETEGTKEEVAKRVAKNK